MGDRVRFHLAGREIEGMVVEDRGPLGAGGRRLLRIEVPMDPTYLAVFEVPVDELRAA